MLAIGGGEGWKKAGRESEKAITLKNFGSKGIGVSEWGRGGRIEQSDLKMIRPGAGVEREGGDRI